MKVLILLSVVFGVATEITTGYHATAVSASIVYFLALLTGFNSRVTTSRNFLRWNEEDRRMAKARSGRLILAFWVVAFYLVVAAVNGA